MSPGFADVPGWRWTLLVLGGLGLLIGGWRSLRQHDLKLLLAYGTVSQLGLLALVFGIGTQASALAGTALLAAHALYKSTLFLVVGVVEHEHRHPRPAPAVGPGPAAPVLAGIAALAVASMLGVPPFLGSVAKEAMYDAVVDWPLAAGWADAALLAVTLAGTAVTVAYGLQFYRGAFATRTPGRPRAISATRSAAPVRGGPTHGSSSWRRRSWRCSGSSPACPRAGSTAG